MKLINPNRIVFSCLSGFNYYLPTAKPDSSPEKATQYMTHIPSDTTVAVRPFESRLLPELLEKWRFFIEQPVDIRHIIWPVDFVQLDEQHTGLVFPCRTYPGMEPIRTLLYDSDLLDWRHSDIQAVIANLLEIFSYLHDGGYAYHAFDINRIFYKKKTCEVLMDFSLAMSKSQDPSARNLFIDSESVKIEFLPPWVEPGNTEAMTLNDDLYSLAALLFRLMIGRMPYQGRLMDGHGDIMDLIRDTDPEIHQQMFLYYHTIPLFVFDRNDTTNSLGLYTHEEIFIERWNALPASVRSVFEHTFSSETLRANSSERHFLSVGDWVRLLKEEKIISEEVKKDDGKNSI